MTIFDAEWMVGCRQTTIVSEHLSGISRKSIQHWNLISDITHDLFLHIHLWFVGGWSEWRSFSLRIPASSIILFAAGNCVY